MRSTTVREELVVALFEDAADIVKRLEALAPVMADTRYSLAEAARDLAAQVKPFKDEMHQIAANEQYKVIHYVRDQVEQTSRAVQEIEAEALKQAGRAVLKEEVGTNLRQLVASLQVIVKGTKRRDTVLTHVTTALVSAACTAGLLMYLLPRDVTAQSGGNVQEASSVEFPAPAQQASQPGPPPKPERARVRK